MKHTKFITLSLLAVTLSTSAHMAQATDLNDLNHVNSQMLKQKNNDQSNDVIVNTLFSNKTAEQKAQLKAQIAKYSDIQYGFGTPVANPSPQKDGDILNNIKAHDPATVQSQLKKMRQAAQDLPKETQNTEVFRKNPK